jgi:hypothetical protein
VKDYENIRRKLAVAQVDRLFRSYPGQESGDPEIVATHIVDLFLRYPQDRGDRVVTRLVEECEFFPRIAKIKKVLDEETGDFRRQAERDARVMLPAPEIEKKDLDWNGLLQKLRGPEEPHWADMAAAKVRAMDGFNEIPDAPLRVWKKLR